MTDPHPQYSVVIATRDRSGLLLSGLTAARRAMTGVQTEYVVVDQSRDDRSRAVCAEFPAVRYLHFERPGISCNRNRGADVAQGEWLLFLDDDTVLSDGFGRKLERVLAAAVDVDLVAPLYSDPSGRLLIEVARDRPTRVSTANLWCASGGCMLVRRDVFLRIGGFDERLGAGRRWGSAEDQDLVVRLIEGGGSCVVEPSLVVVHPRIAAEGRGAWRRAYRYGLGIGAFFRLHLQRSDDLPWLRQARTFMLHPLWEMVHAPTRRTTTIRAAEFVGRWLGLLFGPTPSDASGRVGHSLVCFRALRKGKARVTGTAGD